MAVLIDPPQWPGHGTLWSHLVSDGDLDELHEFARGLGIPRRGFDLDHYDVPASLVERAVAAGARPVSAKTLLSALQRSGLRVKQADRAAITRVRRRQFLTSEWMGLGGRLPGPRPDVESWGSLGATLLARWNEPQRVYHDEIHLEDVLLALDQFGIRGDRPAPVTLLAAWFHDAVYRGDTGGDERESAELAVAELTREGVSHSLAAKVAELILATDPARSADQAEHPLAQLLDADLAIFGASPRRYERYTTAVRKEYAHVPEATFAVGRTRILTGYLDREAIYRTPIAQSLWEERARANLTREIRQLAEQH